MCGISQSSSPDMGLLATFEPQAIKADGLSYREGSGFTAVYTRKYQSCYYEIGANLDDEKLKSLAQQGTTKIELHLKIVKAAHMNVYLYGGESRFDAKTPIIADNAPAVAG